MAASLLPSISASASLSGSLRRMAVQCCQRFIEAGRLLAKAAAPELDRRVQLGGQGLKIGLGLHAHIGIYGHGNAYVTSCNQWPRE